MDKLAPAQSILSEFNPRLREDGVGEAFVEIGDCFLRQAREAGIEPGKIQVVDSVPEVADFDNAADRERQARLVKGASAESPLRMAR